MKAKKILLLTATSAEIPDRLEAMREFIHPEDHILLGIGDHLMEWQIENPFLPVRVFDVNLKKLQGQELVNALNRNGHKKKRLASQLVYDSLFLDILILTKDLLRTIRENRNLFDFLIQVHCPIMIIDETQRDFNEVFLSFNGSEDSFRSIKFFTYLYEDLYRDTRIHLLVKVSDTAMDHENCVYEYLKVRKRNFGISRFFREDYDPEVENMLNQSRSPLVVCGGERLANLNQFLNYSTSRVQPSSLFIL